MTNTEQTPATNTLAATYEAEHDIEAVAAADYDGTPSYDREPDAYKGALLAWARREPANQVKLDLLGMSKAMDTYIAAWDAEHEAEYDDRDADTDTGGE